MKSPKRKPIDLSDVRYGVIEDKFVINLEADGILCLPVIGRNDFRRVHEVRKMHTHEECVEIIYCSRGGLEYESCGQLFSFRPGQIFVSRPNEPHQMKSYPKGMSTYYLLFRIPRGNFPFLKLPPKEAKWLRNAILTMPNRLFDAPDHIPALFCDILSMYNTLPRKSPERSFRLRLAATNLLWEIALASRRAAKPVLDAKIMKIAEDIRLHPEQNMSINSLVAKTFFSPSALIARFKKIVGLPPHAFIISCRIEKAKTELSTSNRPVAAIAQLLGFPSSQHLATLFKRATGMTPRQWRKQESS